MHSAGGSPFGHHFTKNWVPFGSLFWPTWVPMTFGFSANDNPLRLMALTWFFTLQVTEQKTDKLVNSTRKILETKYKQVFLHNLNTSWCSWTSQTLILGREETCGVLWVCYWPGVIWKYGEKDQFVFNTTLIHRLNSCITFQNLTSGREYVPCFFSGQTASGLPHGKTQNTIQLVKRQRLISYDKLLQVDDEVGLPFLEPVSGGRGGGEDEVVKNQAVISISYQVPCHFFISIPYHCSVLHKPLLHFRIGKSWKMLWRFAKLLLYIRRSSGTSDWHLGQWLK